VIGTWFDKCVPILATDVGVVGANRQCRDFDEQGPAGPTAFWKMNDEYDESPEEDEMVHIVDLL